MVRRVLALAVVVALGSVLAMASPASAAKPVERGHYSGTDAFDEEICGLDTHLETAFRGHFITRPAKGSDQAFLAFNNYEFREVITLAGNPTGPYVTTHGNGVFVEQHATHLYGNVYEFEAIDAGSFTLRDSTGKLLIRDRGVVKLTAVFDTLGDNMPGGVLISEDAVFHGKFSEEDAFCAAFVGALT